MAMCEVEGCEEHYGCRLRAKGVQVAPSATPGRHNRKSTRKVPPPENRGVAGEQRAGGTFMPYLDTKLETIPVKHWRDDRRNKTAQLRRAKETARNTGKG